MKAYLSRPGLGLGALDLTSDAYQLDEDGITDAGLVWRRNMVESPFVDGEFEVSAVREAGEVSARVWVLAATGAELAANTTALLVAVEQASYELIVDADGFGYRWTCFRADYRVGTRSGHLRAYVVPVNLSIPVVPGSRPV